MLKRGVLLGLILILCSFFVSAASWDTQIIDSGNYPEIHAVDANTIYISSINSNSDHTLMFANSSDGGTTWSNISIETTGASFGFISMYILDVNTIFISYYNTTDYDLRLANSSDGGKTWSTTLVDGTGNCGQYSSVYALDANNIFVSYVDSSNGDLEFANSSDGGITWTKTTIESTDQVGWHNSIHVADSNNIFVAYRNETGDDLKFANSSDGGNTWETQTIDLEGNVGEYIKLKSLDSNTFYISYYDVTNDDLKFAKSTNLGNSWTVSTIDSSEAGRYTSLKVLNANTLFISHIDYTAPRYVKLSKSTDGGDNWETSNAIMVDAPQYTSIDAIDTNTIFMSYTNTSDSAVYFAEFSATLPTSTEYTTDHGSTNFSAIDVTNVSSMKLANIFSSITWQNGVDAEGEDYDTYIEMGYGFVSVNASALDISINSSAEISFIVTGCVNATAYYASEYYETLADIKANGQVCNSSTTPACTSITCSGNTLTFTVPHFDSYGGEGFLSADAVPEFSTITMLIAMVAVIGGFFMIRRREYI